MGVRIIRLAGALALALCVVSLAVGAGPAAAQVDKLAAHQSAAMGFVDVAQVPKSTTAWALGNSFPPPRSTQHLVLAHGAPSHWSQITVPIPAAENLSLIAAGSKSVVWVAGFKAFPDLSTRPVIRRLSGRHLTKQALPSVGGTGAKLIDIDSSAANDAWAVGFVTEADSEERSLALHWNGHKWARVPVLGDALGSSLISVDTSGPSSAWALGTSASGSVLVVHWNGKVWSASPYTQPQDTQLEAIAGTSASSAFIVGTVDRVSGISELPYFYAARWNGAAWVTTATQSVKNATVIAVTAVGKSAFAVGSLLAGGGSRPLIMSYIGGSWRAQASPHHGASTVLSAVSASSPSRATAVGTTSPSSAAVGLIDALTPHGWKQQPIRR
jgi:hypothetical protein